MTFGDAYITHLTVLQNVGMTRIDPVMYKGKEIIPLQFLKAVLPEPASLGATTKGKTNIGDIATGEGARRIGREDVLYLQYLRSRRRLCRNRQPGESAIPPASRDDRRGMMLTGASGAARACSTSSNSIPIRSWTCSTARPALAGEGTGRAAGVLNLNSRSRPFRGEGWEEGAVPPNSG
jgi:hypothetical protein